MADRCALVIENSHLYQQMKERDRLAALGEMAAGLAHEIRNPLAAIKGATQYLDPSKLPEEDREFLTISTKVARDEVALWRDGPRRNEIVEVRFRDNGPGRGPARFPGEKHAIRESSGSIGPEVPDRE